MKKLLFCIGLVAAMVSCSDEKNPVYDYPGRPGVETIPAVKAEPVSTEAYALEFKVTPENAIEAAYLCLETIDDDVQLSAGEVISQGVAIDATKADTYRAENLYPATEHNIYVAVRNGDRSVLTQIKMTTDAAPEDPENPDEPEAPQPTVTAEAVKAESNALEFTVTPENATEASYLVLESASITNTVAASKVIEEGVAIDAANAGTYRVEELKASTEYTIYVAVRNNSRSALTNIVMTTEAAQSEPVEPEGPVTNPMYIWVDAAANFPDFANSIDNIRRDLTLAKETGFTDIVVDVRPTNGDVLFKTSHCQQVEWLGAWTSSGYNKIRRTATFDYLGTFIEIGHELGLRIHAGFNTMVGGNKSNLGSQGILYRDGSKKEWATTLNTASGFKNTLDTNETTWFFNPLHPGVQDYLCDLLTDLASYEDLDGIILDRGRFDSMQSDFSELTKEAFEEYVGQEVDFLRDVLPAGHSGTINADMPYQYKHLKKWLEFRAKIIHDFMTKAEEAVHSVNPDIKFGVYVGGWYSTYYDVGVNWASPNYNTAAAFSRWATPEYKNYGYADIMDHMLIGAYAGPGGVYGSNEWTMQGFCSLAMTRIMGACPLVCGGPDVGNWDANDNYTVAQEHDAVTKSVKACYDACDGYFLFDMIHLKKGDMWQYAKAGIDEVKASLQ